MANETPKKTVIGLDLGTTFSCIAVEKKGKIEVIANLDGNRLTASAVFFDSPRIIGKVALEKAQDHPARTIHSVKRLIGRKFRENGIQNMANSVEYTIVNVGGSPTSGWTLTVLWKLSGQNKYLQ